MPSGRGLPTPKNQEDNRRLTALFTCPQTPETKEAIWNEILNLIKANASQHLRCTTADEENEIKADALIFAMDLATRGAYDPARGRAYSFFYKAIKNYFSTRMRSSARRRMESIGDKGFSIDDMSRSRVKGRDLAQVARNENHKNWKSYHIHDRRDQEVARAYFEKTIAAAEDAATAPGGEGNTAAVIRATLLQVRRALLGE